VKVQAGSRKEKRNTYTSSSLRDLQDFRSEDLKFQYLAIEPPGRNGSIARKQSYKRPANPEEVQD
jgi:hypothetical protein